jgi:acyl-CoA reductase-like NAD-dependent aldehyde dehydrogenase
LVSSSRKRRILRAKHTVSTEINVAYQTIRPANGEVIGAFPDITGPDLGAAVTRAQTVYESDWRRRSIAGKAEIVSAAAAVLRKNAEEYARCLTLQMGKLIAEAQAEASLLNGLMHKREEMTRCVRKF